MESKQKQKQSHDSLSFCCFALLYFAVPPLLSRLKRNKESKQEQGKAKGAIRSMGKQ